MKTKFKYFFHVLAVIIILFWIGAFVPHYISSHNHQFIGVLKKSVGGHLYVDKDVSVDASRSDLETIGYLFHEDNGIGRAGQDLIVQRIKVMDVGNRGENKLGDGCGNMEVKLYTFFNIKILETGYAKHCP